MNDNDNDLALVARAIGVELDDLFGRIFGLAQELDPMDFSSTTAHWRMLATLTAEVTQASTDILAESTTSTERLAVDLVHELNDVALEYLGCFILPAMSGTPWDDLDNLPRFRDSLVRTFAARTFAARGEVVVAPLNP